MSNFNKIFILITAIVLLLGKSIVFAQEEPLKAIGEVNLDENVQPGDLGIGEPKLLPDSHFYFFKDWARKVKSFFVFNPVKKIELLSKFADEKLIEVKKMIEQKKDLEKINKGIDKYKSELEKIKNQSEEIKKKGSQDSEVSKFLDKWIEHQLLHQRLLQKLEKQVPAQSFENIKEARERHLERFGQIMIKLEDKDKISERLEKSMGEIKGSKYKNFKNLEVLLGLEEKVPEEAKQAIQKAEENVLKRLVDDFEKMTSDEQEGFKDYIENISGDEEKHLEILEDLKLTIPQSKEKLKKAEIKILEKIEKKAQELNCPEWTLPDSGFCQEGKIIIEKSSEGCFLAPKCLMPGEEEPQTGTMEPAVTICPAKWDPVCGRDGKIYINECWARVAKMEIAYTGKCRKCQTDSDCPQPVCVIGAVCSDIESKCIEEECKIVLKEENASLPPIEVEICAQVITPAKSPEGICIEFPTPCDVPKEWEKVEMCP